MNANRLRFAGLLIAVALMNGCAVVDYKNPVDTLNTAIADSVKTISALDDKLTRLQNERWSKQIQSGDLSLGTIDKTCALGTEGCSLRVLFTDGSTKPFPATSLMPKARLALNGLKTYTERLKAIADADTASKVATSANEALGSISKLTTMVANENRKQDTIGNCRRVPGTCSGGDRMVRNPVRGIREVQGPCTVDQACSPGHRDAIHLVRNLRKSGRADRADQCAS